jgi:thiamine-phosphate pyrophosphorylase
LAEGQLILTAPRLLLVAPDLPANLLVDCAIAAAAAGDVASIVVPATLPQAAIKALQDAGLAVLADGAPNPAADGVHVEASEAKATRQTLPKDAILGAFCAASRDAAMEAGEAGADYLAFAQKSQTRGVPIVGWCAELMQLPVVAFDPVSPEDLAALLPQKPDFIRPMDTMWDSPEAAREIVRLLTEAMTG